MLGNPKYIRPNRNEAGSEIGSEHDRRVTQRRPERAFLRWANSFSAFSDRRLPTAIENASTKTSTMPVKMMERRPSTDHSNTGEQPDGGYEAILYPEDKVTNG